MDEYVFSTGPIENQLDQDGTIAKTVYIKIENNNLHKHVTVDVRVYGLDGTKTLIFSNTITVNPHSSSFIIVPLNSTIYEFEVQYEAHHKGVLVSVFPKDAAGNLVAAQRVLNSEFTLISDNEHNGEWEIVGKTYTDKFSANRIRISTRLDCKTTSAHTVLALSGSGKLLPAQGAAWVQELHPGEAFFVPWSVADHVYESVGDDPLLVLRCFPRDLSYKD
jgi:hypothetical protein